MYVFVSAYLFFYIHKVHKTRSSSRHSVVMDRVRAKCVCVCAHMREKERKGVVGDDWDVASLF